MTTAGSLWMAKATEGSSTALDNSLALFVPPFIHRKVSLVATEPAITNHPQCQKVARFLIQPSASKAKRQARQPNAPNYARRKRTRPSGRPAIMKEILGSQRLRKQGNWQEAKLLLEKVKVQAQNDSNYLNEVLHVRVAQLRHTKPSLSAADLYDELYRLSESVPARSNATTFNAILLGLRNCRASQEHDLQSKWGSELDVASQVFDTMLEKQLFPDHYTMSILFQMCASGRSLHHTKNFEKKAKDVFGFQPNVISGSSLLAAYAKCGELDSVEEVLEDLQSRNVMLNERIYASVISAYHRSGCHPKVMECFRASMSSDSVEPNIFIFSGTLASCSKARDAVSARLVFETMMRTGTMPTEDIFGTLFETAVRSGNIELGTQILFDWEPQYGVMKLTLDNIKRLISASKKSPISAPKTLSGVKTIMKRLIEETDLKPDVRILNSLISAFVALGSYGDARRVLDEDFSGLGLEPDVVTYNVLIHSLGRAKRPELAVKALEVMRNNGLTPNQVTYNSLLDLLVEARRLDLANKLIEEMKKEAEVGIDSVGLLLQLKLFRTLKDPKAAMAVHRSCTTEGHLPDSKAHGLLLTILFESGCEDEAVSVFGWLVWKRLATAIVFNVVLDYVARVNNDLEKCFALFDGMKSKGIAPDEVTYSTLIRVCSRSGLIDKAFRLLGEMQDVGLGMTDTYAWTALIDGCGRVGQWQRAMDVLKGMHDAKGTPSLIPAPTTACYTAAIYAGGMRGGGWKMAVEVYQMLNADEDQEPDSVTYSAMASMILNNRFDIQDWGIVREVCEKLKEASEDGDERDVERAQQRASGFMRKVDKAMQKKLVAKMKRVEWVLRQAEEGKLGRKGRTELGDMSGRTGATT